MARSAEALGVILCSVLSDALDPDVLYGVV